MSRYRVRYEEPESGGTFASLMIGAFAGFAVGMLVAQKSGGIAGIAARVKDRWAELEESETDDEAVAASDAAHESSFEDDLDEAELEDEESLEAEFEAEEEDAEDAHAVLEDHVLEAFQADSTLRERAIDISAVGDGLIELSGWVDTDDESHHAAAVARRVAGVESVVNRLAIGHADVADDTRDERRERGARRHVADRDVTREEQE